MIKAHVTSVRVTAGSRPTAAPPVTPSAPARPRPPPTSTATPIDTAIRVATAKAPTRPTHLPYPIVVSFPAAPPVTPGTSLRAGVQQAPCRSIGMCKAPKFRNPDSVQQSIFGNKHRPIAQKAAERHHQQQSRTAGDGGKARRGSQACRTPCSLRDFGGKAVEIYANGYVRVAMFMRDAVPFQKLLSIQVESNVQKKTGPGRVVAAGMTFAANLVLTPNKRGDVFVTIVTIVTEEDVYVLRASPPTIFNIKAAQGLAAAGEGVLKRAATGPSELPRVAVQKPPLKKTAPTVRSSSRQAALKCRYCGSDLRDPSAVTGDRAA